MPHDANGAELKIGDIVNIPAKIKALHMSEEFCNIDVEFIYAMPPTGRRQVLQDLNTKQTEKR